MKKIILTLSIMLLSYFGYGQHIGQYYTLLESTGTYVSLANANYMYSGQNIDNGQFQTSIPFTFNYNGDHYTSLYIGTNGAISFSSNTVFYGNNLSSTNSRDDNIVAPLWDDLFIRSADGGYIAYKTIGTSPHRKFAIEWVNISWRNSGNTVTFKMELEEGSDNIYFYYGPNNSTETRSASIGMKFDRYIDNTHNFLSLTPTVPASVNYSTANNSISSSAYPGNGRIYAFKHKTYVPDTQLESKIETYSSASDGTYHNGYVLTRGLLGFYTTDFSNLNIADATGVEDMKNLQQAKFAHNQLSAIQFYQYNTALTHVDISYNQFTQAPDLSNYTSQIVELKYGDNQLSALDVNTLTSLTRLWCNDNHLESLKVQNGNNTNFTEFHASGNPLLGCIEVDNPTYSQANWTDIDNGAGFSTDCHYGETYVPDTNFEHYLETHGIDTSGQIFTVSVGATNSMGNGVDGDHYVTTANIQHTYNTKLDMPGLNISDLTGIEDFIFLKDLRVENNNISAVNLSHNTALEKIRIFQNQLTTLNVSHNTHLQSLKANLNQLTSIDLSHNTALTIIDLDHNNLTALDLSANTALDAVVVSENQVNSLDVSMLPDLTTLNCSNNQLVTLDVRNGHNASMQHFYATGNSNLTCIYVDAPSASYLSGWSIDSASHFVANETECANTYYTYVPDDHFEHYLETHTASGSVVAVGDSNSMGNGADNDDYVLTGRIENVTHLDVHSQNISDLTGIEDFAALQILNCSQNQLNTIDVSQNANLQSLSASYNNLTGLNVSQNTNLTTLSASSNNISTLILTNSITTLHCGQNQLTGLDVSGLAQLTNLSCNDNQLTAMDVSNNHALTQINCSDNQLTSLDLSNQQDIADIACSNNQLTELLISEGNNGQSDLMYLYCDHNQLTALDLSGFETLEEIECQNNQLEGLNVANGNHANFGNLNFTNNPNLTCIEVDDVTYMDNHWSNAKDAGASYSTACHYNETYVPDDNFEYYLETHTVSGTTVAIGNANSMGNGTYGDDYVSTSKIETVLSLDVAGQNITDMTGIEDFDAMQVLSVNNNQLTNLDVTNNSHLTQLYCQQNQLTSLNIAGLNSLRDVWVNLNHLAALDVSQNPALKLLYVGNNQLTSLDVSNNSALESLYCYVNQLTGLDVNHNPNLKELWAFNNQLTSLDVDSNPLLEVLWCYNNQLTELHIQNGANNLLSGTFTSGSSTYARMRANNNPDLTCIYVDNASAANNSAGYYHDWEKDATATYVADAAECQQLTETYVPDDHFEHYLETHNSIGNPVAVGDPNSLGNGVDNDDYVTTSKIDNLNVLYIYNQNISDLTGIEDFTALQTLSVFSNQLTSLDLSSNTNLQYLYCQHNQLTSINISQNTALKGLNVNDNQLANLDVSNNSALQSLYCYSNQLTSLDVSHNANLKKLRVHNNQLTGFNLDSNPLLEQLWCYDNQLTELHIQNGANNLLSGTFTQSGNTYARMRATGNPALTCIYVDDATAANNGTGDYTGWGKDTTATYVANATECQRLSETYVPDDNFEVYLEANGMGNGVANDDYVTTANIENVTSLDVHGQNISDLTGIEDFTALSTLYCYQNNLTALDITHNTALTILWCNVNQLTSLDISQNTALTELYCTNNQLTTLDASHNTALNKINCFDNRLTSINLGQNTTLTELYCGRNLLSSLDVSDNTSLVKLMCNYNQLTNLDLSHNTAIANIDCSENQLTGLNIKNNHNTIIPDNNFKATNNPDLTCIQVDDAAWSTIHWTQIDATASFSEDCSIVYYSLAVYTSGNGSVSPSSGTYADGTVVTLTATPDAGWEFAGWSGDLTGSTNPAMITIDADKTVTATFTRIQHTLTVHHTGNGSVSLSPAGGTYNEGTTVTLTATPDAGWKFAGWSGDLTGSTNPATITMDADKTVMATFARIQHTLTVNTTGNGSVSLNPAGGTYNEGTTVTLTATPDTGWEFAGWSGDLTGSTNPATITMDADKTVTATFTRIQHTLTVNTTGNGSVSLNPAGGTYNEGTTVTLTATPVAGWEFAGWSGDLTGTNNPATITMDANKTITATFNQLAQTYVPDDNFEHYLEHHDASGNVVALGAVNSMGNGAENDNYVLTSRINTVTHLSIHNQNIADLTGIQDFTALTSIACNGNNLTSVDYSHNTNLTSIDIGYNQISSIDLSSNTALETLSISRNNLTDLDVSMLPNFISLDVSQNHLTGLNVQNGNNTNFVRFNATYNPDLTCIFVDDPAWSDTNWTNIDAASHFVANQTECDNVSIDDEALKSMLKVYPNPVKDQLMVQSETYQNLEVNVYSLIGQELVHQKSNNGNMIVNLKSLPSATYVVKITIDGRSVYYNIVKE